MTDKKDYCVAGICTACNLDEIKACSGYEPSIIIHSGGCCYLAARSGKCLRPEGGNMPTTKGLDEYQKFMDALGELFSNYNKSIRLISGLTAPCERLTPIINEILAKDKEIREEIGSDTTKDI